MTYLELYKAALRKLDGLSEEELLAFVGEPPTKGGEEQEQEVLVGTLTKQWGLNGYHEAGVGHPVYETKDWYVIYLEHTGKLPPARVPFYKETLGPVIAFSNQKKGGTE